MGIRNGYSGSSVTLGGDEKVYRDRQTPSECSYWRRVFGLVRRTATLRPVVRIRSSSLFGKRDILDQTLRTRSDHGPRKSGT